MSQLRLAEALTHANVKAFLRVIRQGESSQDDDAYRMRYHPARRVLIDGPLVGPHPRVFELLPDGSGRKSSAFGAYQFVATTWDGINEKYGLADDISPQSQDLHAAALIDDCRALDDVIAGQFDMALHKCAPQWASLPGSPLQDGGSKIKYETALAVYENFGGRHKESQGQAVAVPPALSGEAAPAPATEFDFGGGEGGSPSPRFPFPDRSFDPQRKPMLPAVAIALGSKLIELLPMFGSGSKVSDRNIAVTQEVAGALLKTAREVVPSAANEQEMVEKILQSPELQARFRAQAAVKWDEIAPFLQFEEESRKEARSFAEQMTGGGPLWRAAGFGLILLVLAIGVVYGGGWILKAVLFEDGTDLQTKGMIIGAIIAFVTQVLSYFFGSSASSRGKDQALADAAKR